MRLNFLSVRQTFYQYDLVYAQDASLPKDPHGFLTAIGGANTRNFAIAAQDQLATFFASQGSTVVDPDGAGPLFETPIDLPLPETLNYIP